MKYNKGKLCDGIEKVNKLIEENPMPTWDQLPALELYMDQVLILLNQYLKIFAIGSEENKFITPPMINNYVKLKIMPAPIKKKYGKIHLAYLIVICSLKQTLSMSTIQKIIPIDLCENEIRKIYETFVKNQKKVLKSTNSQIKTVAQLISENSDENSQSIYELVIENAISSNLTKLLTEKLADMQENDD